MKYAEYSTFSVGDEQSGYRLLVSNYSGNAGRLGLKNNIRETSFEKKIITKTKNRKRRHNILP